MEQQNFYKQQTLVEVAGQGEQESPQHEEMPKQIGMYKIESLLDKGGMSLLYLGIDPVTHELITLKVLSSKYVAYPEMVERFMREAEIIQLTNHPNIVKLYGHGAWEGGVYIAMEFIQGLSLRQMILQEAMSLKRSLQFILQIGHALAHLHAHGIIHRDLKPENVLLTAQGGIKVIDFGISQIYTQKEKHSRVRVMGTPVYMSPEQREDPLNVTFASDIYSLGIIAYELILGRLSHGVIHLSLIPKGLQKILSKALQPKPEDRYEDIIDFIKDLSSYMTSADLKKDMRGSDYLGELSENLKEAQATLLPTVVPNWPKIEISFATNSSTAISSVYYDFVEKESGIYHILMGESLTTGVEGLLHIAMLKGIVRAFSELVHKPTELVSRVNEQIVKEGKENIFSFSFLTLNAREGQLSYISCGYSPLWHIPAGGSMPRRLSADNIALGIASQFEPVEVTANWNVGDTLILHTFQAGLAKGVAQIELDESQFVESLKENMFLSPKQLIEAIYRKVSKRDERAYFERPVTLISVVKTG
jgi:serine/threonine protein kinase